MPGVCKLISVIPRQQMAIHLSYEDHNPYARYSSPSLAVEITPDGDFACKVVALGAQPDLAEKSGLLIFSSE